MERIESITIQYTHTHSLSLSPFSDPEFFYKLKEIQPFLEVYLMDILHY